MVTETDGTPVLAGEKGQTDRKVLHLLRDRYAEKAERSETGAKQIAARLAEGALSGPELAIVQEKGEQAEIEAKRLRRVIKALDAAIGALGG